MTVAGGLLIDDPSPVEPDDVVVPLRAATPSSARSRRSLDAASEPVAPRGPGGLTDERTIAAALVAGQRWALAAAFERWADLVHGVARQLVGRDDADDVTQQVYVEAWRSRATFDPERGELPGWLVGITRNLARAHHRRRGPDPTSLVVDEQRDADPDPTIRPERVVDALVVAAAMRDLADAQRAVVELTLLAGMSQSQAAAELAMPLGTVKSHHRRALARLREALGRSRP